MATTENPNLLEPRQPRKRIRKEFVYWHAWPAENDFAEPVYSGSDQAIDLTWPGIVFGGGLYGLVLYLVQIGVIQGGGVATVEGLLILAVVAVGVAMFVTVVSGLIVHFAIRCLNFVCKSVMSPRRVILIAGGASLIPIGLIHGSILASKIGMLGFAICLLPGIWIGAYLTAWFAAAAGSWTFTDHAPKSFDLLQFQIRDMLIATMVASVVILAEQANPQLSVLPIVSLIAIGFVSLMIFDRQWMKYHGEL